MRFYRVLSSFYSSLLHDTVLMVKFMVKFMVKLSGLVHKVAGFIGNWAMRNPRLSLRR